MYGDEKSKVVYDEIRNVLLRSGRDAAGQLSVLICLAVDGALALALDKNRLMYAVDRAWETRPPDEHERKH